VSRIIGPIAAVLLPALLLLAPAASADDALTARNKEIVREFYTTVFIARNVDAAPKFLNPGYIQHTAGIRQGLKGFMDAFRKNFARKTPPDYKREIIRIVGENDIVILFNRQSGTHPNGWHQVVLQFDMFRLKHGMIVEHWDADPGSTV
jgi:predicted SnoaL-like aldol condensation-catalyzing enzyme